MVNEYPAEWKDQAQAWAKSRYPELSVGTFDQVMEVDRRIIEDGGMPSQLTRDMHYGGAGVADWLARSQVDPDARPDITLAPPAPPSYTPRHDLPDFGGSDYAPGLRRGFERARVDTPDPLGTGLMQGDVGAVAGETARAAAQAPYYGGALAGGYLATQPVVEGDPAIEELTRPSNYIGGGLSAAGLAAGAGMGIVGRLGAEETARHTDNPWLIGGAGLAAGAIGGGVGYGLGRASERVVGKFGDVLGGAGRAAAGEATTVLSPAEEAAVRAAQPFGPTAEEEAARLEAIQADRQQRYGGVPAGQVQRTPGQFGGTISIPQTEAEIRAGNEAAATRAMGDIRPVDPLAPYRDPVSNLLQRIEDAKPLETQNQELLSQFRARQAGAFSGAAEGASGESGFNRAIGAMRGQAERVTFQPLRDAMMPEQIDQLFTMVLQHPELRPFERAQAGEALRNILDGTVPTPSSLTQLETAFPGVTTALRKANVLPKEPWFDRALAIAADVANTPRSLMTSGDLSATFRQSAMAAPSHPRAWVQAMKDQIAAYASEAGARDAMERINTHPLREYLDRMRVDILPLSSDAPFSRREEAFMSRLAGKVPLVERSQRAYTTALNSMRAGVAYDILDGMSAEQLASMSDQRLQRLGRLVNALTGRGSIPHALEKYQPELNAVFFSPRNTFGKVQAHAALLSTDGVVRREAAKALFSYYGTGTSLLALARYSGARVGMVPGSSDFGKIVLPGGTRLDIWGGNAQLFRLVHDIATGKTVDADGNAYEQDRLTAVQRFLRSKLAPVPGEAATVKSGRDYVGRPWKPTSEQIGADAVSLLTPMFLQDMYQAGRIGGVGEGALAGIGSALGVGVQAQPTSALDVAARQQFGSRFRDLEPGQKDALLKAHPDLQKQRIERGSPEQQAAYAFTQEARSAVAAAGRYLEQGHDDAGHPFSAVEYRKAITEQQTALRYQKQGVYANAGTSAGKDPILDSYFSALDAATNDAGQVDFNALDQWHAENDGKAVAGKSSDTWGAYVERNTGLSFKGDKTYDAYKGDLKAIAQSGYWQSGDDLARQFGGALDLKGVRSRSDLENAITRLVLDSVGDSPESRFAAPMIVRELMSPYDDMASTLRLGLLVDHPDVAAKLERWGYGLSDVGRAIALLNSR